MGVFLRILRHAAAALYISIALVERPKMLTGPMLGYEVHWNGVILLLPTI